MKILLINGQASQVQGWGDAATTQCVRQALEANGKTVEILDVLTLDDLQQGLTERHFDLVWSSIYQISTNTEFIGLDFNVPWVQEILEEQGIPYVGSSAPVVQTMLDKANTQHVLARNSVPVPYQVRVGLGETAPIVDFPVFVKPRYESQSAGISEESIVESRQALLERIRYIHETFQQCALIEEFLPGAELTVSMLGPSEHRAAQYEAAINILKPSSYTKHPVILTDIANDLELKPAGARAHRAEALAAAAVSALECRDHVRVDMREDRAGNLKVIEVNGIPSLTPGQSRSYTIHQLYNPELQADECFDSLIGAIIDAALSRVSQPTEKWVSQATGARSYG